MYAVVKIRNQQFRVEPESRIQVPLLDQAPGDKVTFDEVLLCSDGSEVKVGAPCVAGCSVSAEVVRHGRDKKILILKKKRRKNYRRTGGHRQHFTEIRVTEIVTG